MSPWGFAFLMLALVAVLALLASGRQEHREARERARAEDARPGPEEGTTWAEARLRLEIDRPEPAGRWTLPSAPEAAFDFADFPAVRAFSDRSAPDWSVPDGSVPDWSAQDWPDPGEGALLLLAANGRDRILAHSRAVSRCAAGLAASFGLDAEKCALLGLAHDVGGVVSAQAMLRHAQARGWPLDEAERKHPFLLHQTFSALIARDALGLRDPELLAAIACHTTLRRDPSAYDLMLFVADKLAWDGEGRPPYEEALRAGLRTSLADAARAYMRYQLDRGLLLAPHRSFLEALRWLERA